MSDLSITLDFVRALKARMPRVENQITAFPKLVQEPLEEITGMLDRVDPERLDLPVRLATRIRDGLQGLTNYGIFDRQLPYMADAQLHFALGDIRNAIILAAIETGADIRSFAPIDLNERPLRDPQWVVAAL